jgi:hypothetical protein
MLLIGRVVFGAAAALRQSSFDAYIVHEHSSQGFPDDWLSQTFSFLTHGMALVAALSGVMGQTATSASPLGAAALCVVLFAVAGAYIALVWSKDGFTGSKFLLVPFLQHLGQTVQAARSNRQVLLLAGLLVASESAIMVFTFYWAPWLFGLVSPEVGRGLPYEIIYSSFIVASMLGSYLHQLAGSEGLLQTLLVVAAGAFFLGAVFQTSSLAFLVSLVRPSSFVSRRQLSCRRWCRCVSGGTGPAPGRSVAASSCRSFGPVWSPSAGEWSLSLISSLRGRTGYSPCWCRRCC